MLWDPSNEPWLTLEAPLLAWRGPQGELRLSRAGAPIGGPLLGVAPPLPPGALGAASFRAAHGVTGNLMACAMAGGVSSVPMVEAMSRAGRLAIFGAGGLPIDEVEAAVRALGDRLGPNAPWGVNLLASPSEPAAELALAERLVAGRAPVVVASAFLEPTPALVWLHAHALRRGPDGSVTRAPRLMVKLSSPALAARFLAPPPASMLAELVGSGKLTAEQARIAGQTPLTEDITVEGDSGGHTDRQPALLLLAALIELRRRLGVTARVGLAGGLGTPEAVAAAFVAGADYVVTGSVNQATVEAGTSAAVKRLLCRLSHGQTDFAPAADMLEIGASVQVVKSGTLFPGRARRLQQLWQQHGGWDDLPEPTRQELETTYFRAPVAEVRRAVYAWAAERDPALAAAAARDPRVDLALLVRWYLGLSSRWARAGVEERAVDWQIWCGPAMAAFNAWVAGSALAPPEARGVVAVNDALLRGAALSLRARMLTLQGVPVPDALLHPRPPQPQR